MECKKCGKKYDKSRRKSCPKCGSSKFIELELPQLEEGLIAPVDTLSHSAHIAISSAKIVNGYGTLLQVIGMILGVVIAIGGIIVARGTGYVLYGVCGVIIGLFDLAIFAVQGALFRMVSNYVIARLEG